jgi:hypothetical protein
MPLSRNKGPLLVEGPLSVLKLPFVTNGVECRLVTRSEYSQFYDSCLISEYG